MTDNITINTHSSIRIEGDKILWFDPFQVKTASNDADLIFITHDHHDHLDPPSIDQVGNAHSIFIGPATIRGALTKAAGERSMYLLEPGDEIELSGIRIKAVPAYNKLKPFHPKHNKWIGYLVTMNGTSYYVAGDTDVLKELGSLTCDVALLPVGGTYTMTAKEAAKLVNEVKPKAAIPTHYGNIVGSPEDGETFAKLVDPAIKVVKKL
ncbi:MAG: MBL fold metallo-hydrolase [Eubacterium sp.]|nr:MBL fold metallo-hydrolase [Eubacterium sp.]